MKAGREQTLLKIRYNGADRFVEPYSLKYQAKRNGDEREYFYVWNRSGGSNLPGIRALLPEGFQSIENTDEKFTPQFSIELCKAGELPEDRYLFDPNKPMRAPSSKSTTGFPKRSTGSLKKQSFAPKYVYQCSFCGRKFTKSTRNADLREHKNKDGYRCGGRRGYYVDTKY